VLSPTEGEVVLTTLSAPLYRTSLAHLPAASPEQLVSVCFGDGRDSLPVPNMRDLTDEELADPKQQRDHNLDALSDITVQEVTDTPSEN
jgi:hypothetical protein